jgi:hypothetical protein
MYGLSTFVVSHFGNAASVDDANVSHFATLGPRYTDISQLAFDRGCLSKIKLAAKSEIYGLQTLYVEIVVHHKYSVFGCKVSHFSLDSR